MWPFLISPNINNFIDKNLHSSFNVNYFFFDMNTKTKKPRSLISNMYGQTSEDQFYLKKFQLQIFKYDFQFFALIWNKLMKTDAHDCCFTVNDQFGTRPKNKIW